MNILLLLIGIILGMLVAPTCYQIFAPGIHQRLCDLKEEIDDIKEHERLVVELLQKAEKRTKFISSIMKYENQENETRK